MIKLLARHLRRGQEGEKAAVQFLKRQGLHIVAKNVRYPCGEIDVIAKDGDSIVFVEVRLRQANAMVSAAQSINMSKQQKWKRAAQQYLQQHYTEMPDCRFDAVLLTADKEKIIAIEWIKGVLL